MGNSIVKLPKQNAKITHKRRVSPYLLFILLLVFSNVRITAQYQSPLSFSKDNYQFEPFELPGGKLDNVIQCMAQDSIGVLWIGTQNGLVKYDGRQFERLLHNPLDSNSLISNYVECLYVDSEGILWIGAYAGGFTKYNPTTNQFQQYYLKGADGEILPTMGVNTIIQYQQYIWLGTNNGLHRFDPELELFKSYYFNPNSTDILTANVVRALYVDHQRTLWVGMGFTWDPDQTKGGLYKYQSAKDDFLEYKHNATNKNSLSDNRVKGIFEDTKNNFWVATMGDGLNKMDREKEQFISYPYQPSHPDRLSHPIVTNVQYRDNFYNQTQFIHEDRDNRLWIGSFDNGLNIYDPIADKQIHFERGINGLATNNIWNIFESNDHTLFICTGADGQGKNYKLNIKRNLFPFYAISKETEIIQFVEDTNYKIWLGNSKNTDLWHFDPENKLLNLETSKLKENDLSIEIATEENRLSNLPTPLFQKLMSPTMDIQHIWETYEHVSTSKITFNDLFLQCLKKDKAGNIWMGTWGHGLLYVDTQNKSIEVFKHSATRSASIGGDHVSVIFEDKKGAIWVGGGKEAKNLNFPFFLDRFEEDADTFIHFYPEGTDYGFPVSIAEDKEGNFWYPTVLDGIHQLEVATGKIIKYNKTNSLIPSDEIRALVIDAMDNIWMTSENTIIRFTPNRASFIEYTETEGLKVDKFGNDAAMITRDNTIYFGGFGGFHAFNPEQVIQSEDQSLPKIIISEIVVRTEGATDSEEEGIKKMNPNHPNIELTHLENSIDIGFTCIDYQAPNHVFLEYKLENQDRNWRKADANKTAQYYNLQPGSYALKVRGTNSRGILNKKGTQLTIIIAPPWWKTTWAYILFLGIVLGLLYWLREFELNRQLASQRTKHLEELNQAKTHLYTNITHEFRTPLTVILGMTNKMNRYFKDRNSFRHQEAVKLVNRNGEQLLRLVNQMLDLSKLESKSMSLDMEQGDIIVFIKYLFESFQSYAESKNIRLHFSREMESLQMDFDRAKIQQIISNLLSNAIKFTPTNGLINLHLGQENGNNFLIKVQDAGIGIPKENIPFIFDRFYQAETVANRQGAGVGTGIGLALTKELVQLLKGTITVNSIVDEGTTFTVLLPITTFAAFSKNASLLAEDIAISSPLSSAAFSSSLVLEDDIPNNQHQLLIVEDNPDVILYLKACLEEQYQLTFAQDGQQGIDKAIELIPDIIISDVMMPKKDGFELCHTLKTDTRTSHIPIVLLTAKATMLDKIAGLEHGADAYLSKPFQPKELEVRLRKLIELRTKLQSRYVNGTIPQSDNNPTLQIEDEFVLKVRSIVLGDLDNPDFSVETLCKNIFLSRQQVHRKLTALTGQSTSHFIRSIRLQAAKKLLETTNKSITEIAFDVGFKEVSYFSKVFGDTFGHPPSFLRK